MPWSHSLLSRAVLSQTNADPYRDLDFWKVEPEERIIMASFDYHTERWLESEHLVRMEREPFARGSMRTCYRVKKLSSFVDHPTWENASAYVAKCYTRVPENNHDFNRQMVRMDVRIQMLAKKYADQFNQRNPPKKIDVMQVVIFEFPDRTGSPCFCVERYLEGSYIKYNNNVGYIDAGHRHTPQAFSHFSFEQSFGQLMVVDIQGVGDLYTDPQIHSVISEDSFGEGNLGLVGYSLFFHTHECNSICRHLDLKPFDHYPYTSVPSVLGGTGNTGETTSDISNLAMDLKRTHWRSNFSTLPNKTINSNVNPKTILASLKAMQSQLPPDHKWISDLNQALVILKPICEEWCPPENNKAVKQLESGMEDFNLNEQKSKEHAVISIHRVTGQVHRCIGQHFQLLDNRFAIPTNRAEMTSIILFHYQQAAKHDSVEAALALSNIYAELPCQELDNSVLRLASKDVVSSVVYAEIAGKLGSRLGWLKVALAYDSVNCPIGGVDEGSEDETSKSRKLLPEWNTKRLLRAYDAYKQVISIDEWTSLDYQSQSFELNMGCHEINANMARIMETGDYGIVADKQIALEMWQKAAESAELEMKARKALHYYEQISRLTY